MQSAEKEESFHYMCARCLSDVREARAREVGAHRVQEYWTELFLLLYRPWTLKYTLFYVKMPVFASILLNTVGLKWKQTAEKENWAALKVTAV